jgi:hypothetical protein
MLESSNEYGCHPDISLKTSTKFYMSAGSRFQGIKSENIFAVATVMMNSK